MDNMKNTGIVKKELRQEIAMFGSDKNLEIQKAKYYSSFISLVSQPQ